MLHNEVASSEKAGLDWVKHACRRMKHFAALPQNMKHRRCGMKQSLFRLHSAIFLAIQKCFYIVRVGLGGLCDFVCTLDLCKVVKKNPPAAWAVGRLVFFGVSL